MALSDQSEFPEFFSPRKVNLKIGLVLEDAWPRMAKSRKMTHWEWPNPGRWLPEEDQIPEDNLPRMVKSQKITYQEWPNPGRWRTDIRHNTSLLYDKLESQKRIWWNQQPKAIFRGQAIPAFHKPELIGIFKLTVRGLRNTSKSLWLVKAIPGILQPH